MFSILFPFLFFVPILQVLSCGYETCPKSYDHSKLHLHIISHSHDDVGWLQTPDTLADSSANPLLTAVVEALHRHHNRKFVEVEMYFFKRWWQRQLNTTHEIVRKLVRTGQLTFAGGGWCVNDEATTHYSAIIDQMTLGNDFIREQFGECAVPKLSWEIDPFGASREAANLFAQMGFDGHVTNRGNDQLFGEFIWNTSAGHQIFTTRTHHHYHAPDGFNFEDHDQITEANKHAKAKTLVELGRKWNKDYGSKGHVLMTFGHDFAYKHAERWFSNLDKLIEVVNSDFHDVHLHYSSPHCYIKAVRDLKPKLNVKSGDFFPYYTGYFTSRPQVKYLDRFANQFLQAAKQLEVLAELSNTQGLIFEAKNELGVIQHHDAITGTSRPTVMFDYKQRLVNSIRATQKVISQALAKLTNKATHQLEPFIYTTVNISDFTLHLTKQTFATIIYNPLGHPQQSWIRIPVNSKSHYKVLDSAGGEVGHVSLVPINEKVKQMVGHHHEISHELVFKTQLPALGFTTIFVVKDEHGKSSPEQKIETDQNHNFVLKGKNIELTVDHQTGGILSAKKNGQNHKINQKFAYYAVNHSSDAYKFCPKHGAVDLKHATFVHAAKYSGFAEVTLKVENWIWQTIRMYEDKEFVELDLIVGPVDDKDHVSKEVITRFETDLKSNGMWYTDANGRQNMQRHRNQFKLGYCPVHQSFTLNYYPVTSRASIRDETHPTGLQLTVLPDRSVGAASMHDGQLELMLHRRFLESMPSGIGMNDIDDDGKGVVARGKLLLLLSNLDEVADQTKQLTKEIFAQPIIGFKPIDSVPEYQKSHNLHFTGLKSPLPNNVNLLTLENQGKVDKNEILLRFENFYETNDKSTLNVESKLSLDVLTNLKIHKVDKVNLLGGGVKSSLKTHDLNLAPNEIRTYILSVKRNISNSCHLKWEHLKNHKLPAHAVLAGHELNNSPLHICRHKNSADLIPGKYSPGIHCRISKGGQELIFNDDQIEILTDSTGSATYQWVPRHGGDAVSDHAFVAGHAHNIPMYVGRCAKDGLVVGKIDEYFYYAYGRKEHKDCIDHEILTC